MKGNILIVDENAESLRKLEQILTSDGCMVRVAVNGETALRALGECSPDLILFGVLMSGMDGFYVCRLLKGDPSTSAIPLLFISALPQTGEKLLAFAAGCDDCITRPFTEQEFLARVRTHLGLASTRRDLLRANLALERDIKARKAAEERYRLIFEQSPDSIMIMDPASMGFVDFNSKAHSLLGYSREEFASLTLFDIIEALPAGIRQRIASCAYDEEHELEIKRKDGEKIAVTLSMSVKKDEEGNISACWGIARDVTELKMLEDQLFQARKMESIGLLAGGVAHDFNNILTVIAGYGQILRENIDTDNGLLQESVAQILKSSNRAAELIRGLLAFRRKRMTDPLPVHIETLIVNTGKLIQRVIGEDIEFCTSFADKKLYVMADAGQIEQVLMTLAAHARAAMPHGGRLLISTMGVTIKEGCEALHGLSAPGEYAMISVAFSAGAMDKRSMGRSFEPLYAAKEVGKERALGLSTLKGIIRQHKGGVMVCNEAGSGTALNIYLPLVDTCAAREESKKPPAIAGGTETILVAEDEIIVREYLKNLLERAGYRVVVAGDGEEAVAMFEEHDDISLVLSDVVMPKKNGVEILMEIKKRRPAVKMIFISGYSADAIRKMGNIEDNVEYIAKPFDKSRILSKIREVLDNKQT
jgi:two-component system cell cycle sensor histidine kinase/response regulator CckA